MIPSCICTHRVKATQSSSSESSKDTKTSPNRVIMTPCNIFIQGVDATMFTAVIPGAKFEVSYTCMYILLFFRCCFLTNVELQNQWPSHSPRSRTGSQHGRLPAVIPGTDGWCVEAWPGDGAGRLRGQAWVHSGAGKAGTGNGRHRSQGTYVCT